MYILYLGREAIGHTHTHTHTHYLYYIIYNIYGRHYVALTAKPSTRALLYRGSPTYTYIIIVIYDADRGDKRTRCAVYSGPLDLQSRLCRLCTVRCTTLYNIYIYIYIYEYTRGDSRKGSFVVRICTKSEGTAYIDGYYIRIIYNNIMQQHYSLKIVSCI